MANIKINDLVAYTDPVSTDVLAIVDVGNDLTKKVSIADLVENAGTGSAAAPSFSFDGDNNTGIYRPAADQVALTAGGTQALLAESTGITIPGNLTVSGTTTTIDTTTLVVEDKNIEIGKVSTPSNTTADGGGITLKGSTDKTITWVNSTGAWTFNQPVSVTGDLTIPDKIIHSGDTNTAIRFPAADTFAVETAGTERFRIDSSGNASIGTSTFNLPSGKGLQVYDSSTPRIKLANSTTGTGSTDGSLLYVSGSDLLIENKESANMRFYTAATERLRISSDGNVFIGGTTAANADIALNANGTATFVGDVVVGNNPASGSTNNGLMFRATGGVIARRASGTDTLFAVFINGNAL